MTTFHTHSLFTRCRPILAPAILIFALAGCGSDGDDGAPGAQGEPGEQGPPGPSIGPLTGLSIKVDSVTVSSAPVAKFTVTNQNGQPFAALVPNDLRFTIAKLMPGAGTPSNWQSYILITQTATAAGAPGAAPPARKTVQATRETPASSADVSLPPPYPAGSLANHGNGKYTYTFKQDITNVACPAPCKDAFGNTLDVSYNANLTHRVGIQTRGDTPMANATFDFVPAGGAVATRRDIVKTESCNECHDKIEAHDARIEVKYCVTCHNLGSTDPDSENRAKDAPAGKPASVRSSGTVDFKVMIHKIHRGASLPSVEAGGEYAIWGYRNTKHTFGETVVVDPGPPPVTETRGIHLPQDIRNCTKCHDAADPETPQGGNWNTVQSIEACGSCHDNIKFDVSGPPIGADPDGHPGGVVVDNTECKTCHATGRIAGSVAESHTIPDKVARAKFKYNILEICGVAVVNGAADTAAVPACQAGGAPTVKFSVEDPTGAGGHGYGNFYNIRSPGGDNEFTGSGASLNILIAWDTRDYNNTDGSGSRPARANSTNVRTSPNVVDNGDGTFTLTSPDVIPNGLGANAYVVDGTGTIGMEGHPAGAFDGDGVFNDRVPVNSEVAYFGISDSPPKPRRQVVDVPTKCDRCHDIVSFHGANRNNNGQLCVLCHNAKNTDIARRPAGAPAGTPDNKREESVDFKRLIHGIHAASEKAFDGTIEHGFREKGLVVYGYGGSVHDYSHVRFPGVLSKCTTCHLDDTYTLADRSADGGGNWEMPAQNGILGSVTNTGADRALRSDDLGISPIAAVCSSCHDGELAKQHMVSLGGALFDVDVATLIGPTVETCAVCHGPGKLADVELVHSEGFGEAIP